MAKQRSFSVSLVFTRQDTGSIFTALRVVHVSAPGKDEAFGIAYAKVREVEDEKDLLLSLSYVMEINP